MKRWLFSNATVDPIVSIGLLLFRVSIGAMMIGLHGWGKYQNFAQLKEKFQVPQTVILSTWMNSTTALACTIFAEVVCCALLMFGFATRAAAAVLAFTMAIAAFVVMNAQSLANKDKELAVMYLAASVLLLFTGAGAYSFDARFSIVKKRMFS